MSSRVHSYLYRHGLRCRIGSTWLASDNLRIYGFGEPIISGWIRNVWVVGLHLQHFGQSRPHVCQFSYRCPGKKILGHRLGWSSDICLGGRCLGGVWCLGLVVMALAALWSEHMRGACAGGQLCVGFWRVKTYFEAITQREYWNVYVWFKGVICVIQGSYICLIGPWEGQNQLLVDRGLLNKPICCWFSHRCIYL